MYLFWLKTTMLLIVHENISIVSYFIMIKVNDIEVKKMYDYEINACYIIQIIW